ncbi:MAG: hypothetical protein AAF682_01605 [Planctomycetota bacterium]
MKFFSLLHVLPAIAAAVLGTSAISASPLPTLPLAQDEKFEPPKDEEDDKDKGKGKLVIDFHSRIADPKLTYGGVQIAMHLAGYFGSLPICVDVYGPTGFVRNVWCGTVTGLMSYLITWDGKDFNGDWVDTGTYTVTITNPVAMVGYYGLPVEIVRLGVTGIEWDNSCFGTDEWQMVYFMKNGIDGVFYSTPATGEYSNLAPSDVSDVDLNNGDPRSDVPLHTATDEPVMNGFNYETNRFNYPVSYTRGAPPQLHVTVGDGGTTVGGAPMSSNYPVPGYDIRMRAGFPGVTDYSGAISPGDTVTFEAGALPNDVSRTDWEIFWRWEYSGDGGATWRSIPGWHQTTHRFYTIWGPPIFKSGASGTQYDGPWVEVADYVSSWGDTLGISTSSSGGVVEAFVKGFFGQNGGIAGAIEGVIYDAYPVGGDGGANHYMGFGVGSNMNLSALLNGAANGVYVNCSDNMGSQTTMLSMIGIPGMQPVRLGNMTLNAIWGIGTAAYTTDLWGFGSSSHGFSYHHISTRNGGVDVIDTCMQLDEDGNPGSTPGTPGWNVDRPWAGTNGYDQLSATNTVSTTLETLPGLQ